MEKQILMKINELGLRIPDDAQKSFYERNRPIARVEIFYEPKICLFVDRPVHEKDYVQEEYERKRRELRGFGYRVFSVKSLDEIINLGNVLR